MLLIQNLSQAMYTHIQAVVQALVKQHCFQRHFEMAQTQADDNASSHLVGRKRDEVGVRVHEGHPSAPNTQRVGQ